jgi:hypothetical protein
MEKLLTILREAIVLVVGCFCWKRRVDTEMWRQTLGFYTWKVVPHIPHRNLIFSQQKQLYPADL